MALFPFKRDATTVAATCSYTVVCSKELFNTSGVSQLVLFSKPTFLSSSKLFAVVSSCASGILIFAASNSALQIDLLTT